MKRLFFIITIILSAGLIAEESITAAANGIPGAVDNDPGAAGRNVLAIQGAIDRIAAKDGPYRGSGTVVIPHGVFYIDGSLSLPSGVGIRGESRESSVLKVVGPECQYPVLAIGDEADFSKPEFWGRNGSLRLEKFSIIGNWTGKTEPGTGTGIRITSGSHIHIDSVGIHYFNGYGIHYRNIGYSSVSRSSVTAIGRDGIWLESYSISNACTSMQILSSQISTCFGSSIKVSDAINIEVRGCQLEDSGIMAQGGGAEKPAGAGASVLQGRNNRNIVFTCNYIENIHSPYLIVTGGADGTGVVFRNNHLGVDRQNRAAYEPRKRGWLTAKNGCEFSDY